MSISRDDLRRNILQILNEEWANGTNSEITYMILDKVDKYFKEAKAKNELKMG